MKGFFNIFNKTIDIKDHFNTLLAIEGEQQFLHDFAQMRPHWTYDEVMTSVTDVHTLLVHVVKRKWFEALPVALDWACQFWKRPILWKTVVGGVDDESACDWLIQHALQGQDAKGMLEMGTHQLAKEGEALILSYWIEQSFQAVGSFNLSDACYWAAVRERMDNVTVMVGRMNSLQVAGLMVRAGEQNKHDLIDCLYTPELGRLVAHVTGPKERGSMSEGMVYLRQRIASDADQRAITNAIGAHTSLTSKARKI